MARLHSKFCHLERHLNNPAFGQSRAFKSHCLDLSPGAMTLKKSLAISESRFPHLQNGNSAIQQMFQNSYLQASKARDVEVSKTQIVLAILKCNFWREEAVNKDP